VAVTFLSLVRVLGHAGTFWLYGVIAIGAGFFFYLLVPRQRQKPGTDPSPIGERKKAEGTIDRESKMRAGIARIAWNSKGRCRMRRLIHPIKYNSLSIVVFALFVVAFSHKLLPVGD